MVTPESLSRSFSEELDRYRRHKRGEYAGTSLADLYWREVMRGNAVRFGNLHKKLYGNYPLGFEEVSKKHRR